jgi:hypothetical protein
MRRARSKLGVDNMCETMEVKKPTAKREEPKNNKPATGLNRFINSSQATNSVDAIPTRLHRAETDIPLAVRRSLVPF